jgi:DNA-binding transcriptional LysR family regulator
MYNIFISVYGGNPMENRDWEILKLLYKEKNITKASELLYMSQPALTKRLQHIEKEFNVEIVNRGRRGVYFTPKGEYLAKCADDMLNRLQSITDNLSNIDDDMEGTLRIGSSYFFARYKLPEILSLFKSKYPKVEFKVTTRWSNEIFNLANSQSLHVAFIRGGYNWQEHKHLLLEETLCLVAAKEIDLKNLPKLHRIDYQGDVKLKELINTWWWDNYCEPPLIGMEVDKTDTCREMVIKGLGYAILPSLIVNDTTDIFKMNILNKDGQPIKRETWMFYTEEFLDLKLVKTFVDFVKSLKLNDSNFC